VGQLADNLIGRRPIFEKTVRLDFWRAGDIPPEANFMLAG
jgi:hypothetical protein